jgi:hypothetical protein
MNRELTKLFWQSKYPDSNPQQWQSFFFLFSFFKQQTHPMLFNFRLSKGYISLQVPPGREMDYKGALILLRYEGPEKATRWG